MLAFVLSATVLYLPVLSATVLYLPVLSATVLLCLLSTSSFSLNSSFFMGYFMYDEVSFFMLLMSLLVFFVSYFFSIRSSLLCNLCMTLMLGLSYVVFSTSNLLFLYVSYEFSLIPIIVIILKWGSYSDRSFSCFLMLVYTSVFSLPFMFYLIWYFDQSGSLSFYSSSLMLDSFGSVLFFLVFGVKLPVYGLHFWLPMAHVEAPTFGSIVLAGILLKLGGVGLIRVAPFLNLKFLLSVYLSYLIFFSIYSSLVCCSQSDFKRLVAYSSVAHMMLVPLLVFSDQLLGLKMAVVLMFIHGLASPLMFMLVSVFYTIFSTRQIVMMRGVLVLSPILSLLCAFSFFISVSAPPFPGFVNEVYSFLSFSVLSSFVYLVPIFVPFLSLVYNLFWFSTLFGPVSNSKVVCNTFFTFKDMLPIFFTVFLFLPVSFLFSFF